MDPPWGIERHTREFWVQDATPRESVMSNCSLSHWHLLTGRMPHSRDANRFSDLLAHKTLLSSSHHIHGLEIQHGLGEPRVGLPIHRPGTQNHHAVSCVESTSLPANHGDQMVSLWNGGQFRTRRLLCDHQGGRVKEVSAWRHRLPSRYGQDSWRGSSVQSLAGSNPNDAAL
jgi:hypothetical protein